MLSPDQFNVNDVWIAIRVNDSFLYAQDESYDVYVLLDAASTYVFGHAMARVVDEEPEEAELKSLFTAAWSSKREWARKLIMPQHLPAVKVFEKICQQYGLAFETIVDAELEPIIGSLKTAFAKALWGNTGQESG